MGRYVAYFTGVIQSGHQSSPYYTFLWTFLMGACILLENPGNGLIPKRRAARFILFFGVNWAVFLSMASLLPFYI